MSDTRTTRSGVKFPTACPLFKKELAAAKKRSIAKGKKTSAATPKKNTISTPQVAVAQLTRPTPASNPDASDIGPVTRSKKRKSDAAFEASPANESDVDTTHQGDLLTTNEEENVPAKKQRRAPTKSSSNQKRKRTEEDRAFEEEKNTPRPVKRVRSSASKTEMVKEHVVKREELTNEVVSASPSQATIAVGERASVESTIVAADRETEAVDSELCVKAQRDEEWHVLSVEGNGFKATLSAPSIDTRAPMTQTNEDNSNDEHALNSVSTKVNQEERKGEKDGSTGPGEKDKKEENMGKSVIRHASSRRIKKFKSSRSRRTRRDVFSETGKLLNNDNDNNSDSDTTNSDSDILESDSDSDIDMASTPAPTPSSSTRPYSPRRESTTCNPPHTPTTDTTDTTTPDDNNNDDDDDDIPTISSKKVHRGLAGLSDEEDDKASKSQHYYEAEYIDCGNGDSFTSCSTHKRKIKTAEEKRNRTEQEKQNDEMYDYFEAATERLRKAALKKAMRNYKATAKPAIQDS